MGVSTSDQLYRLRKLSVEKEHLSIAPAQPSSPAAVSGSSPSKPVLRKGEAVDLVEVEGGLSS